MIHRVLADAVVGLHFAFVLFVPLGGLLALKWTRLAWIHVPAAVWGVMIEFLGWTCPLTPLENTLRAKAGEYAYSGGFIDHYVLPVLYPAGLTRGSQIALGVGALVVNLLVYWRVLRGRRPDP
jgi:hypothetical protein